MASQNRDGKAGADQPKPDKASDYAGQEVEHKLTPEEKEQMDEDAVPSAVAKGGAFGLFGAAIGAVIDSRNNKKLVKELEIKAKKDSAAKAAEKSVTYGPASQDIL